MGDTDTTTGDCVACGATTDRWEHGSPTGYPLCPACHAQAVADPRVVDLETALRDALSERAEARAELARLRADSPAAKAATLMPDGMRFTSTDADLILRAVLACREPGYLRWSVVGARFGLGSTFATALCRAVGVDPDESTPWGEVCEACGADLREGGEE